MPTRDDFHLNVRREFSRLDDDVLLDTREAAAVLGLTRHALIGWRRGGYPDNGPPRILLCPRNWRYRVGDIREWIAKHRAAA